MKKYLLLAMVMIMMISAASCNRPGVTSNEKGEMVTLKWLMPGPGEQQDSDMVWEEFNKKLKTYPGMENVQVDIEVIPVADYAQKYLLIQTSGEKVDIIQTYKLDYILEARNGSFMPLDDLINKETPDFKGQLPSWVWDYGLVDGETYIVPNYQQMNKAIWSVVTQADLAGQYWDVEKAEKVFKSNKTFNEECYDVIEEYLAALKDAGKIGLGFTGGNQSGKGYENLVDQYVISTYDDHPKVYHHYMTPETKLKYMKVAEWYKKGYIRKDSLSAEPQKDIGKKDGYTVWFEQTMEGAENRLESKYGYDLTVVWTDDSYYIPYICAAGGNAIAAGSKHPKEAIKLIELMNTEKGRELYNLLVYGIEDTHYKKISDDKIETFDYVGQSNSSAKYGLWKWIVGNAYYAFDTQNEIDGWKQYIFKEVNENGTGKTKYSKLIGFTPDLSALESKIAQISAVTGEYGKSLGSGALPNAEQIYEECIAKLNMAGNLEVTAELQRQVDEFLASKK